MSMEEAAGERAFIGWAGTECVAHGTLTEVARAAKHVLDSDRTATVTVIDAETAQTVDIDFSGTPDEVVARLRSRRAQGADGRGQAVDAGGATWADSGQAQPRSPGRPRLGVVAREVTLLPRHWEWLNAQPGGASVTLRKLVEEARRTRAGDERARQARDTCYAFLQKIAGNEPGYEEVLRALYAGDKTRFEQLTEEWSPDLCHHARRLAEASFE